MAKEKLKIHDLAIMLQRIPELVDPVIYGGVAYLGWKAFGGVSGALFGPIALKLAQANNMAAGAAGVAGLATLGISHGVGIDFQGMVTALLDPDMVIIDGELMSKKNVIAPTISGTFPFELKCPEGYELKRGPSAAFCVKKDVTET